MPDGSDHDGPARDAGGRVGDDPDAALLARLAAGDDEAARQLAARHLGRLHGHAMRMLGDRAEAEDVVQDTFIKAWRIAPRWREGQARFSTWLYQVASNACLDRLRRRRPTEDIDERVDAAPGPGPEAVLAEAQRGAQVQAALDALPPRQKTALLLFHHQGLSQAEASAAMGISEDALESLLARARRTLRAQFRGDTP